MHSNDYVESNTQLKGYSLSAMKFSSLFASAILILSNAAAAAKTVEYSWTLKPRRASAKDPSLSVDCNLDRLMLLVNDQFPGPVIKADVGDKVIVNIINQSPTASISLHFHGLHMLGQPYKDGTATVTQCASGPLQSQTYEFIVLDQGTHYWHGRELSCLLCLNTTFAPIYLYVLTTYVLYVHQTQAWNVVTDSKVQSLFLIPTTTTKSSSGHNMMMRQLFSCKIGE